MVWLLFIKWLDILKISSLVGKQVSYFDLIYPYFFGRASIMSKYFEINTQEGSAAFRCGVCDNCTTPGQNVESIDITKEVGTVLRILTALKGGDKVTLLKLIDLWMGKKSSPLINASPERKQMNIPPASRFKKDVSLYHLFFGDLLVGNRT